MEEKFHILSQSALTLANYFVTGRTKLPALISER